MKLTTPVSIRTFPFTEMDHHTLTCTNHPELRWLTKNPYSRSIFYTSDNLGPECSCPMGDLVVIEAPDPIQPLLDLLKPVHL